MHIVRAWDQMLLSVTLQVYQVPKVCGKRFSTMSVGTGARDALAHREYRSVASIGDVRGCGEPRRFSRIVTGGTAFQRPGRSAGTA